MPVFGQVEKGASPEDLEKGKGKVARVLEHRMTPAQLKKFLQTRTSGQMFGNFESYASLLWAINEVGVWDEGTDVGKIQLQCPFPENYRPTWKEHMDVLARQVGCSWHYDHATGYWVFDKKKMEPPFKLKIAEGWTRKDQGQDVVFVPPIAPVGMDVYMMGHYSGDDPAKLPEIFANARQHVSLRFAKHFKADATEADFTTEKVCGEDAWFFSAPTPRDSKSRWRQWAFVKNGWCFVIVSVISDENESKLLPDVKGMISSFQVIEPKE